MSTDRERYDDNNNIVIKLNVTRLYYITFYYSHATRTQKKKKKRFLHCFSNPSMTFNPTRFLDGTSNAVGHRRGV